MITMPTEVKDIRLLRRMEKAGFIKLHHQTGQKITGLYDKQNYFICTYIDEGRPSFVFEGWIIDSLTKHNYLYIYTCRDNVEVVLEDIENLKKDEPEIFDIYDLEFEIPEENPIYKLYIAYD